jgi:hypothetical protein
MKKFKDLGHYINSNCVVYIRHLALLMKPKILHYYGRGVLLKCGRQGVYTGFF